MSQYNQYNVSVDGKSPLFNYMPYRAAGAAGASTAWTLSNSNPVSVRGNRCDVNILKVDMFLYRTHPTSPTPGLRRMFRCSYSG